MLPLGLNTAPQVFTRLGHTVTAYLHRQGVSVIPYLDDWLVHHPDRQILLRHQALLIDTLDLVGFILNRKKSELDVTQDLQDLLGIHLRLDLGRALLPRVQGWGDSRLRAPSILPQGTKLFSSVPPYGFTQLGLRSYPSGSFVPETSSASFLFVRSDKPVYATAPIRPCGPCQPTAAMAGPTFSYLRNPDPPLSGGLHNLHGRLQSGLGRSHGGFQDFGYLDPYRPQAPHQLSGAQGGYLRPTALGSSASGPGHDRHGQFDSGFIYQQAGRDSLHFPATLDCRAFPLVRVTRHNSPGETHSRLPERDSRPPISSESANTDRVVPTPRDRETHLQVLGDTRSRHVCDTVELPPSSVHVSSSGVKSPNGGCSVSRLAGEVNVHVSTFSPAQQGRAEITVQSSGRGDPRSPLVAVSTVVPTPTTSSLCGTLVDSPIPSRSSVPAGPEVHLRWKVIPSARMEALMRHYKAAGFSDEVSRLAAAPRRPSTNRMYDDRWCRFTRWAHSRSGSLFSF